MATALIKSPAIDSRYACFKLEIRESKIHRRGVYALERIPAGRKVKVLGDGDLKTKIKVRADAFSKSALDKIAAVGGFAELVKPSES